MTEQPTKTKCPECGEEKIFTLEENGFTIKELHSKDCLFFRRMFDYKPKLTNQP